MSVVCPLMGVFCTKFSQIITSFGAKQKLQIAIDKVVKLKGCRVITTMAQIVRQGKQWRDTKNKLN